MIRIGIIGTGGMAACHVEGFNNIKSCKIVACCDIDRERVEAFSKKHNIEYHFTDVDEMLDSVKLDAVSVVTVDRAHAEVSLKAIKRGINVLCEKPLAMNAKDAREMADAAKRKGIITGVNFTNRKSAAVQYASKLVSEGKLGRIKHVDASQLQSWLVSKIWGDWHTSRSFLWRLSTKHYSQGILGDIGVHIYDLVSFIAGDFAEINCSLKTYDKGVKKIGEYVLDANDCFISTIKFKNGAFGTISSSRWATGCIGTVVIRVFGEKAGIEINSVRGANFDTLRICRGKNVEEGEWEEIKCPKVPNSYEKFINSIRTGKQGKPDFETGARVQLYIDKSFESNKLGKWVKI